VKSSLSKLDNNLRTSVDSAVILRIAGASRRLAKHAETPREASALTPEGQYCKTHVSKQRR
jgi:hypothetical protein